MAVFFRKTMMIMPNWCWNTLHVGQTMTNPSKLPLKSSLQGKGIRESIYADYEGWHVCFFLLGRQHMKKNKGSCVLDQLIIQQKPLRNP
jgi:hypothetical protein